MLIIALAIITVIVLHVAGPFRSFLHWSIVNEITPWMVLSCLAHSIIEECIFRHVFWSAVPEIISYERRASLVWLNVLLFWLAHVIIIYRARYVSNTLSPVYESTTYNMSVLFIALMLNAVYLETGRGSIFNCILVHFAFIITWTVFLGGGSDDYFAKYRPPESLQSAATIMSDFVSRAVKTR